MNFLLSLLVMIVSSLNFVSFTSVHNVALLRPFLGLYLS